MATNNTFTKREKSAIDGFNKKISVEERKLAVSAQIAEEKKAKALKKLAKSNDKQLKALKLSLLGNSEEVNAAAKKKIDAFDAKQYWDRRKTAFDYTSALFAAQKDNTLDDAKKQALTDKYFLEVEALDKKRADYVSKVKEGVPSKIVKGSVDYNEGEKQLQAKREQSVKELEELNAALTEANAITYAEKKAATDKKVAALNEKLRPYAERSSHELDDDVILSMRGLCKYFGGLKAVDDLTFDVKKGEIFGLIGPNGAGKTTVFNCITQFYKPTKGDVLYRAPKGNIMELNQEKVHDVIKYGIVRTFQNLELVWELNILGNLLVAAHSQYHTGYFTHMLHLPSLAREEKYMAVKAMTILKFLGLEQYAFYYPFGMPYGILKKVELARTLMCDPKLIILDEPAAGLNDKETEDLAVVIKKIRDEYNATIFLVEHDMGLVMGICDRICAISFGRMLALGTPKEIQANPKVQEAYLGSDGEE